MADFSVAAGAGTAAGFFLGIIGHEVATARTADAMGDRSGRMTRRTTFSPEAHYDPLGTIILPAIFTLASFVGANLGRPLFGWGKPHQINPRAFRRYRRDMWIVSLAGPAATLLIGVIAGVAFRALYPCSQVFVSGPSFAATFVASIGVVCVWLTVIELLPIPGRDGARVLALYLPPRAALKMHELEDYAVLFIILVFLVLYPIANNLGVPAIRAVIGLRC